MDARKAFAAAAALFFAVTMVGTVWAITTEPSRDVDGLVNYAAPASSPLDASLPPYAPGYLYVDAPISINIETHGIYAGYGGAVRLGLNNSLGTDDLYVTGARIRWNDIVVDKEETVLANGGTEVSLGLLWLPGPLSVGEQNYQVSLRLLVNSTNGWRKLGAAGNEWTSFQQGKLEAKAKATASSYANYSNYYAYYDRANALLETEPASVASALTEATAGMGQRYTYERLCGVFDWVSENIKYINESSGKDNWQSPETTMQLGGGDCEDFALLINDMVLRMGGAAKLYLIQDHAFASVWIGNDTSEAENAIRGYYGASVQLTAIKEADGYWLVADPLGSLYLGGLPVGGAPVESGSVWDFTKTDVRHSIDMTRRPGKVQPWEQDRLMALLQLSSDILFAASIMLLVHRQSGHVCAACGRRCVGTVVVCPKCGEIYHPYCAKAALCQKCGAVLPLPPDAPMAKESRPPPPPTSR